MNTKLISILIPVHNVDKYIARCIDSIIEQQNNEIEILLGDDGSEDASGSICDDYAQKYGCVSAFHNDNLGAGAERNFLLGRAAGLYVWFVDADDTVAPHSIEKVCSLIIRNDHPEILSMAYRRFDDRDVYGRLESVPSQPGVITGKEYLLQGNFCGYLWNKVYKRAFLMENDVHFDVRLVNQEDNLFNLRTILPCQRILMSSLHAYNYFQSNPMSTLRNTSKRQKERNVRDTLLGEKEMLRLMDGIADEELKAAVTKVLRMNVAGFLYSLYVDCHPLVEIRAVIKQLRQWGLYPVKRTRNKKVNFFLLGANIEKLFLLLCRIKGARP